MINSRTFSATLLIFTITFSCKPKQAENLEETARRSSRSEAVLSKILPSSDLILVDLVSIKLTIGKYSDLCNNVKYVPLETTPDYLIGGMDGGLMFNPVHYFSEDNREYLLGLIDPFQLKKHTTSEEFAKSNSKKKSLKNLADKINETDNQILMIVRLK